MTGFDFATADARDHVTKSVLDFAHETLHLDLRLNDARYPWEIAQIDEPTTLREILDASGLPATLPDPVLDAKLDEPMRLGKALLLYSRLQGWEGVLSLDEESPCYQQLRRYTDWDQ